ncbi:hypothetical protein FVEG_10635 [Fusarium verticillioides 7600]|uniref:Uncharacterized protein n=1 Tax=Gibberella moniliformis (strain M3125 / FGSC 7600) TaxID=334819 RepID=W7MVM3_GIBM7|nr:hypothetical protein FVEG_10635 [Fusarium verticillioides 7600]EWG51745.1 hypothetical protein FVEG_10635 [Fusarium verticillioides 7600]
MPGRLYKVSLRQLAEIANHKRQVPQIPSRHWRRGDLDKGQGRHRAQIYGRQQRERRNPPGNSVIDRLGQRIYPQAVQQSMVNLRDISLKHQLDRVSAKLQALSHPQSINLRPDSSRTQSLKRLLGKPLQPNSRYIIKVLHLVPPLLVTESSGDEYVDYRGAPYRGSRRQSRDVVGSASAHTNTESTRGQRSRNRSTSRNAADDHRQVPPIPPQETIVPRQQEDQHFKVPQQVSLDRRLQQCHFNHLGYPTRCLYRVNNLIHHINFLQVTLRADRMLGIVNQVLQTIDIQLEEHRRTPER